MSSAGKSALSTTLIRSVNLPSLSFVEEASRPPSELFHRYESILSESRLSWIEQHRLVRRLGSGGQGVVYLCERVGADLFRLPVALKIFSPANYVDAPAYDEAMARMTRVALRIALIQQDNLIDVHNVIELNRIRLLEMEWVDGYDLQRLLSPEMLERVRSRVSLDRWEYINDVIVTAGASQPRLKPGVAIAVLRDGLAALSALHRDGILHGDIKPSNIMVKRTGNAKLIDIGSAFVRADGTRPTAWTPAYAAPEVLEGDSGSPRSDLASLGYVLIEMLSGVLPFAGVSNPLELRDIKKSLVRRLPEILPDDVRCNELLMNLIACLIAPNPADRFSSAEEADLVDEGAAGFHRQLVHGNLASEYQNEIRVWLEELE
jgi:serine/threonine-protein kinase